MSFQNPKTGLFSSLALSKCLGYHFKTLTFLKLVEVEFLRNRRITEEEVSFKQPSFLMLLSPSDKRV